MGCSPRRAAFAVACALAAAGAVRAQKGAGAHQGAGGDAQLTSRLDDAFRTAGQALWGIALCAVDGKVVWCEGRGMQDRARTPIDRLSLFDLGNLADRLTVVAVLQLLDQKHWQLDDPIARVLSDWPKDKAAITWRHLVEHRSGLPPTADWGGGRNAARRPAIGAIAATALVDLPGRSCHWSLLNSNLLALLVDQVTGDFQDYVQKRVFGPAGMTGARFLDDKKIDAAHETLRAAGAAPPTPAREFLWDWGQRGGRGVLASVDDLSAFAAALCGTRLLDAKELAALLQPLPGGDALRVQSVACAGVEWTELHGAITGYRARLLVLPKARAWVALLADERDLDPLANALASALAPALAQHVAAPAAAPAASAPVAAAPAPAAAPTQAPVPEARLRRFLGVFELRSGSRIEVVRDGDGIALCALGLEAAARLQAGKWPIADLDAALRQSEDRCVLGIVPLWTGSGGPAPKCFAGDSAVQSCKQQLERIAARIGKGGAMQFAGTETGSNRRSWVRVQGPRGTAWLRVSWSTRMAITSVAESSEPPPFRVRCRVERADWAVGQAGGAALTVSIEGLGAGRRVVLEDGAGLAEARWVADLR